MNSRITGVITNYRSEITGVMNYNIGIAGVEITGVAEVYKWKSCHRKIKAAIGLFYFGSFH